MRFFVTGATGFIGTELVNELIGGGHQVRGLARSDASAEQLQAAGAEVHRGDLEDLDSLRQGAADADVVVNLAFDHDFSNFAQNGENERKAIEALGSVLEPGKLLVVTSGIGLARGGPGHLRTESDRRRVPLPYRDTRNRLQGAQPTAACVWQSCACPRCMTRASRDW